MKMFAVSARKNDNRIFLPGVPFRGLGRQTSIDLKRLSTSNVYRPQTSIDLNVYRPQTSIDLKRLSTSNVYRPQRLSTSNVYRPQKFIKLLSILVGHCFVHVPFVFDDIFSKTRNFVPGVSVGTPGTVKIF